MAKDDKEKIGFVRAHRFRADKKDPTACEYDDGTLEDHKELFPVENPRARIEYAKPHRLVRRKDNDGGCDYCGESPDDHVKYFPEYNPDAVGIQTTATQIEKGGFREAFTPVPKVERDG